MAIYPNKGNLTFQEHFHKRWEALTDPHVRSLAWLLDAPDLLAPHAPQWQGKIASLTFEFESLRRWLKELDSDPRPLHAWLNQRPHCRLGRYAERLMAFYFMHDGSLIEHGLQLQGPNRETIGEFDFLLRAGSGVLHLEFATKFYLLEMQELRSDGSQPSNYFIGPNLADTLGLKMKKIIEHQLSLARHPAVQTQLPYSVDASQALVKGWLFYHESQAPDPGASGLADEHCRGFWCTAAEFSRKTDQEYLVLPRLSWLAPARAPIEDVLNKRTLVNMLAEKFQDEIMPVLIAVVERQGNQATEIERGFIVPDDWQTRAGQRRLLASD